MVKWKLSPRVELLLRPHWISVMPVWSVPLVEAGALLIVVTASAAIATSASVSSILIKTLLLMIL